VTAVDTLAPVDGELGDLARQFVTWLETGLRPEAMFAEDVFADLTVPHWRVQVQGADAAFHLREDQHPFRGEVRVESLDRTSRGFLLQFEERWADAGQRWYCRELIHGTVIDGRIAELAIYCTGDRDEALQQRHADHVRLLRP
jgi:hypothetical protein